MFRIRSLEIAAFLREVRRHRHSDRWIHIVLWTLSSFVATETFAGDPTVSLNIEKSPDTNWLVQVRCESAPGTLYLLYGSTDLIHWTHQQTRVAVTNVLCLPLRIDGAVNEFYRLETIPIHPLDSMIWIEPGEFVMGSPPDEVGRFLNKEEPQTRVTLTRGYWICRYETTQAEFEDIAGFNPSLFKGDAQRPVEDVTWFDAVDYCTKLTKRERRAGNLPEGFAYRLPTEAEWEYAARAGTTTRFSYGDDPDYAQLPNYAWYNRNSGLRSHPVGKKLPNPWGIYDLHGNVFEWGSDWFGELPGGWVTDPQGPDGGTDRIIRGGYWDSIPAFCRSAMRVHFPPNTRISYLGFRVVLAETTNH